LPLLVVYELAAFALAGDAVSGVRNGADVLLKSLFLTLGGRQGLLLFNTMLLGGLVALAWRDLRKSGGKLVPGVFAGMMAESIAGGLVFGIVAGSLTAILLGGIPLLALAQMSALGLPTQLTISLGAGIYEELLFRVLLVGALVWLARRLFGWKPVTAGIFATVLGAFLFSAFHYIGPYGDPLELGSFMFRFVAGLLFSGMYLLRGLGITAWTHALYDVFLTVMMAGR
jgi:membrane protease YdiL (CAAX protease family)